MKTGIDTIDEALPHGFPDSGLILISGNSTPHQFSVLKTMTSGLAQNFDKTLIVSQHEANWNTRDFATIAPNAAVLATDSCTRSLRQVFDARNAELYNLLVVDSIPYRITLFDVPGIHGLLSNNPIQLSIVNVVREGTGRTEILESLLQQCTLSFEIQEHGGTVNIKISTRENSQKYNMRQGNPENQPNIQKEDTLSE